MLQLSYKDLGISAIIYRCPWCKAHARRCNKRPSEIGRIERGTKIYNLCERDIPGFWYWTNGKKEAALTYPKPLACPFCGRNLLRGERQ